MIDGDARRDGRPAIFTYGIQREGMYDEEVRTNGVVATVAVRTSTSSARFRATAIDAADDDRVNLNSTSGARYWATAADATDHRVPLYSTVEARPNKTLL